MRRREFITHLCGATVAWPLVARAQQPGQIARIGVLNTGLDDAVAGGLGYRAFVAELQKLGFAQGRNLIIDYGRTDQGADKAFADAAAMARSNVAVIVASGSELPLQAAVAASSSIPIVMLANNYDPIARGYVASLSRPAGQITVDAAFGHSSLRWLGISDLIAEPEGPSFISRTVTYRRLDRRYS
jgi:putative ABC transport system substrate-binding protein